MMHIDKKNPWTSKVPSPQLERMKDPMGLRGKSFDEGDKALAPKDDTPEGRPSKYSVDQLQRCGIAFHAFSGEINTTGALLGLKGLQDFFPSETVRVQARLSDVDPALGRALDPVLAAVRGLCAAAGGLEGMDFGEDVYQAFEDSVEQGTKVSETRGKFFDKRGERQDMLERGDKIGAWFAKQDLKRRQKKIARRTDKHKGKKEIAYGKLDEARQRIRQALAGARAALETALAGARDRLVAAGCRGDEVATFPQQMETALVEAIVRTQFNFGEMLNGRRNG